MRPAYKMPICHADALFDSEFYRRKIIKNLRKLSRKLVEKYKSTSAHIGSTEWWEDCSRKKKLTESYKIYQSAFIAPFYGKRQEITPV